MSKSIQTGISMGLFYCIRVLNRVAKKLIQTAIIIEIDN